MFTVGRLNSGLYGEGYVFTVERLNSGLYGEKVLCLRLED